MIDHRCCDSFSVPQLLRFFIFNIAGSLEIQCHLFYIDILSK